MPLPIKYDAHEMESRWIADWESSRIYAWDSTASRENTFVVDTPPPTVSGSLHVGHLFSYSHQDFIVRYQRMRGKSIFFPIGWDDNGLPTERRVQNLYNVKCEGHLHYDPNFKAERGRKGDPQKISRKNFIELCEVATKEDEMAFRHLWTRLGLSYDWNEEYATIDEHCRRISQLSFLKLYLFGHVYHDERPVMWDVDFQTAIAQAEIVDKEVPGEFYFLNFGIEQTDQKIVIATTRPELLPACVAVFVHPDDQRYELLVGKTAITPIFQVPVPIIADEKVVPDKGTGIVMCCTFGDQVDVQWWLENELPLRNILQRNGLFVHFVPFYEAGGKKTFPVNVEVFEERENWTAGWGSWIPSLDPESARQEYEALAGKSVKAARKSIVDRMEALGGVYASPNIKVTHSVKYYEKGDRPLELIPTRQWYVRLLDKKESLVEQGRKISWHPEFMERRYIDWVEGLTQDWCLSRQRYFGVAIPLWYQIADNGDVDYQKVIVPRFDQLPIDPLVDTPTGFHPDDRDKPYGFTGDPDIFDTWATSSMTPQISSKWLLDPARHKKLFPADIRPQSHEIIRTWAFYTIAKAYMHEREIPWRNVVISGWILDPDRKKMSKSQGNVVTPEPLIDEFGADSVRYWAARARLGVDTAYDEQVFKVGKRLCTKLFNASKFAIGRFADIPVERLGLDKIVEEMDRAAIAQLRPVIRRATEAFDAFDYAQALSLSEEFFWNTFCDNYLEIAKPRTYDEILTAERLSAAATLRILHRAIVRLLAPYLPFITEDIWHWAYNTDAGMAESVHKSPWPTLDELAAIPEPLEQDLWPSALTVIEAVRKAKADANLSIKAPVKRVVVAANAAQSAALSHAVPDITRMLEIAEFDLRSAIGAEELTVEVELATGT